jgi:Fe-S cluster assembly protein SufD
MSDTKLRNVGIDRKNVEELSERLNEPAWMRELRLLAWRLFEEMPMPRHKDEAWRRFPVRQIPSLDEVPFVASREPEEIDSLRKLPKAFAKSLASEKGVSGTMVHLDGNPVYRSLSRELEQEGVVFLPLSEAVREYPDLVKRYFMSDGVSLTENKFAALHGALWNGGLFLYVPENVRVELPLQTLVGIREPGLGSFYHTLVVADRGSSVAILEDRVSEPSGEALNSDVVEIFVGEGARVEYVNLQQWDTERWNFTTQHTVVDRDGDFVWLVGSLGGGRTKDFIRTDLVGPGASSRVYGFMFLEGKQLVDQSTYQRHVAGNTYSNLLFRNVLRDKARSVFYGMIRVEPEAQATDAYQANNNLMLSEDARADTIPGLEIIANDVRCSHGATVGRIDPDQLFYLQARGLPKVEAERLIVHGFFEPILSQIPLEDVRDKMSGIVDKRFGR